MNFKVYTGFSSSRIHYELSLPFIDMSAFVYICMESLFFSKCAAKKCTVPLSVNCYITNFRHPGFLQNSCWSGFKKKFGLTKTSRAISSWLDLIPDNVRYNITTDYFYWQEMYNFLLSHFYFHYLWINSTLCKLMLTHLCIHPTTVQCSFTTIYRLGVIFLWWLCNYCLYGEYF